MINVEQSGERVAPADFPLLRAQLHAWRAHLAETEWTPWLIIGLAALLRLFLLALKPPHFDEGINGWFVDAHIVKEGFYRYDPTNYHGPLHFYVLFLFKCLFGRNLWALRLPVVIVSTICVWLALKFEPFVGRNVSRLAALAMAVSPGFVFYGRYSIHEVWLVLFSMMFIFGLLGLRRVGTLGYLWCTAMGVTGMILTKETYILHIVCALLALIAFKISHWLSPIPDARRVQQSWDYVDLAVVSATGIALIVFFYSGTFRHWSGVRGIFGAYAPWFETGSHGHGHDKPPYYWLGLITRYEWPVLAGLVLCLFWRSFKTFSLRYLAIYGVGTLAAYSIVNYKTPWCIISIVWPFLFIFGAMLSLVPLKFKPAIYRRVAIVLFVFLVFAVTYAFWKKFDHAWPFALILGAALLLITLRSAEMTRALIAVLLCGSLGWTIVLNFFRCTTDTEQYVYVQTYNDVWKLSRPLLTLAKRNPLYYHLVGHLIRPSSYPLPWLLGDFPNVGYYEHEKMPTKMDADFLLVQEEKIAEVESKLRETYFTEPLTIRPYQDTSKAFFNAKRFQEFFPGRAPDFVGKAHD